MSVANKIATLEKDEHYMAYIKVQKLKYDEVGNIKSGSAAIVDTFYEPATADKRYHSRQKVRESLGKIISLSEDHKQGIFLSKTRGLVSYNVTTDEFQAVDADDPNVEDSNFGNLTEVHTVFGDVFLVLSYLIQSGFIGILRQVTSKDADYQRLLCHLLHKLLKLGSKISCPDFIEKSWASYLFDKVLFSTLYPDSRFFSMLGDDKYRMAYFKAFVEYERQENPEFGKACYVDSTPLPNDIKDNPFNALCCHGLKGSEVQLRMVLVLDQATGLPVWYDIIPGNVLDLSTLMNITEDVAVSLDIEIISYVLDAGYVSKPIIQTFHIGHKKTLIARMPAKKGYPHKQLYKELKNEIGHSEHDFIREDSPYFGYRKMIEIFGTFEYAYVYVDRFNALSKYRNFMVNHYEEYSDLNPEEKDWCSVKNGYFVLISNVDTTPEDMLNQYFARTDIEGVFKSCKEYLDLLPLNKWTDESVRGKILLDMIGEIILLKMRKITVPSGYSYTNIIGKTQSLMCFMNKQKEVTVETPNKLVKLFYNLFNVEIPNHIKIDDVKSELLL